MFFSRFRFHVFLEIATVILACQMFVIPWCYTVGELTVVMLLVGVSMGVIDFTANQKMIHLFGANISPFIQVCSFVASDICNFEEHCITVKYEMILVMQIVWSVSNKLNMHEIFRFVESETLNIDHCYLWNLSSEHFIYSNPPNNIKN